MSDKLVKVGSFAALTPTDDQFGLQDIVNINMGGSGVDPAMLDRVKVPSGGSLSWEVPGIDGEPEPKKELVGVIVGVQNIRTFYATKYEGGNEPPDCFSRDGVHGEPVTDAAIKSGCTGRCAECPMSAWHGHVKPQCQERKLVMLLEPDSMLPLVINVPPTSLDPINKYMLRLTGKKTLYFRVVTSLKLIKEKNAAGIEYAKISPSFVRLLSEEEAASAYQLYKSLGNVISSVAREEATNK